MPAGEYQQHLHEGLRVSYATTRFSSSSSKSLIWIAWRMLLGLWIGAIYAMA